MIRTLRFPRSFVILSALLIVRPVSAQTPDSVDTIPTGLVPGLSPLPASGRPPPARSAEERATTKGNRYGLAFAAALGTSPLGEIAERHGTYGIPGRQFEVRVFARTPERRAWSVALLWDDYDIGRQLDRTTSYAFDYDSRSLVVGFRTGSDGQGPRLVYGWDAGWLRYSIRSESISYYTGEPYPSRTTGDAVLLAFSTGLEVPGESFATVPRVRFEVNFPDFGGGDGYSALHPETDIGLKASFGIALKIDDLL